MAWFSYHGGHSGQFCRHAEGRLEDVVRAALGRGFTTYGLSEHGPRDRPEDLMPIEADLTPADLHRTFAAYAEEALRLREAYADRLEILVGFETEALPPDTWPVRMREIRADLPACDYVIGSVHHVDGTCIDESPGLTARAAEEQGGREALEVAYFELVARVASELRPEVLGHLDLIRKFDGPAPRLTARAWPAVDGALEAARAAGSLLDVNAAPARRGLGPVYPLPEILDRARSIGVGVTLGDDSHGPDTVGVGLDACLEAIAAAGYREVHQLVRRDGGLRSEPVPIDEVRPAAPAASRPKRAPRARP